MKGQLSLDFYISILVFILFSMYIVLQLVNIIPTYSREVNVQALRSEAYQVSELLINDPGKPIDWYSGYADNQINRIGLSNHTIYVIQRAPGDYVLSNLTNVVSFAKITTLNSKCHIPGGYTRLKSWLGITDFQFILTLNDSSGNNLLTCLPPTIDARSTKISVDRIVSFSDNRYGVLSLQVW